MLLPLDKKISRVILERTNVVSGKNHNETHTPLVRENRGLRTHDNSVNNALDYRSSLNVTLYFLFIQYSV